MTSFTTLKSRSRQFLSKLDAMAKALDYNPHDDAIKRIRELERQVGALKDSEQQVPYQRGVQAKQT